MVGKVLERTTPQRSQQLRSLINLITSCLSDDLLKPKYRRQKNRKKVSGHCYIVSECVWHLLGATQSLYRPFYVKHEGTTHWYLKSHSGAVLDATRAQFKTTPPYSLGVACGFLTKKPSKRAQTLMQRVKAKL